MHKHSPRHITGRPLGALLIVALFLGACGQGQPPGEDGNDGAQPATVEADTPRQDAVTASHRATATLQAIADSRVVARSRGLVEELRVEEGDTVEQGQVLAVLDDRQLSLERDQAQAQVDELEQEYRHTRDLVEREIESPEAAQKIRFQLEAERARLALTELELDETRIKAPIDGVVSERMIRRGDHVNDGDEIFRVTDPDHLEVEVHVPQRLVSRLMPGQSVEIRGESSPDNAHSGRVIRISPVVDEESGTVRTTVYVDAGNGELRPGGFARLRIHYDTREDALLVPRRALRFGNGNAELFVIEDGKARHRDVRIGTDDGEWVEITDGLAADEKVVTFGQATLREGMEVEILDPDQRIAGSSEG